MFNSAPATGSTETIVSILPLLLVLLPMAGAVAVGLLGDYHKRLRDMVSAAVGLTTFILAAALFPLVSRGVVVFDLDHFIGLGLSFRVDFFSFVFTAFVSLIWLLVILYSSGYMQQEKASTRYFVFLLFTMGGCLGVFLTADFFSLFLFFEAMTLFSYVLVVQSQTEAALDAGRTYLYMGIFGGLCLLSAMLLMQSQTGTLAVAANLEAFSGHDSLRSIIALLFFIGFGIKAAAVPLHVWMPRAYEVAPAPINAISSAAMLKAGAYGLIRVFNQFLTPTSGDSVLWYQTELLGYAVLWIGLLTMATGAILALSQSNAMRVLAYSSVSQMGYILMGIGAAAYLGYEGAMGFAGVSYHIINHAFFKASMFLMLATIFLRTRNLDYSKLGGLWRSFPVTTVAFILAAAAISGIPGLNGYASKTLLHHAIVEAFEHHHLTSLWLAEKIFVVTSGLTFCYILRLVISIFYGQPHTDSFSFARETTRERLIFGAFSLVILAGGLFPAQVIKNIIIPMGTVFNYDAYGMAYVAKTSVWNIHDINGIALSLAIGAITYFILNRTDFTMPQSTLATPKLRWFSIEEWFYQPILTTVLFAYATVGRLVELFTVGILTAGINPLRVVAQATGYFDGSVLPWIGCRLLSASAKIREKSHVLVVRKVREAQVHIRQLELSVFSTLIKLDYNPRGEQLYRRLTLMNLDLCVFIVIIMLVIAFGIWVFNTIGL